MKLAMVLYWLPSADHKRDLFSSGIVYNIIIIYLQWVEFPFK